MCTYIRRCKTDLSYVHIHAYKQCRTVNMYIYVYVYLYIYIYVYGFGIGVYVYIRMSTVKEGVRVGGATAAVRERANRSFAKDAPHTSHPTPSTYTYIYIQ